MKKNAPCSVLTKRLRNFLCRIILKKEQKKVSSNFFELTLFFVYFDCLYRFLTNVRSNLRQRWLRTLPSNSYHSLQRSFSRSTVSKVFLTLCHGEIRHFSLLRLLRQKFCPVPLQKTNCRSRIRFVHVLVPKFCRLLVRLFG